MYHTTSSCLINGRNVAHFFDIDLPNILKIMETDIQTNNYSISEINGYMKQQILSYLERKSNPERPSTKMSVTHGVDEPHTLLDSNIKQDSRKEENDKADTNIEKATKAENDLTENTETNLEAESEASFHINCATPIDSVENAILKEMKMMNELLLATKFQLKNFQQETTLQLSQLRDEIASVKNTISLANQQSTDIEQTVIDMKQANDALHRKLHNPIDNEYGRTLQREHLNYKKVIIKEADMIQKREKSLQLSNNLK
ncbi:hypothetical protein DPMN_075387 [Dreissena polymorpha]|uniref:Uncharacterized protein n=1 Tax=Dreissena polymorpha TaxID=45954 RepID=A0A9D4BML7_DREPO|nr:hypothetical protein DPMN_075387 [Dreissena polymorpha]